MEKSEKIIKNQPGESKPGKNKSGDKLVTLAVFFIFAVLAINIILKTCFALMPDPAGKAASWYVSPVLLDNRGQMIHARLSAEDEWCLPIPLEDMGYWLPKVLLAVEDKRFYYHHGLDYLALARASLQNIIAGRIVSGASTISSQLIRISNPRPRTAKTKIIEFLEAIKLEKKLTKNEILELYLNRAPFGGPIRGAEAASLLYFGKRAMDLSLGEASLLVGLLKGPTAYRPDRNPQKALERRQFIIKKTAKNSSFPQDLLELALREKLPEYKSSLPNRYWHFADLAFSKSFGSNKKVLYHVFERDEKSRKRSKQGYDAGIIRSSLDHRLQIMLERAIEKNLTKASPKITAAGIIVENATGLIRAYLGNARFSASQDRGWVDCALALRSPGSTLKPFLYTRLMDEGKINPSSLLADSPLSFSGLAPRNFSRTYLGPVSVRYALASSLNAPAVRVQRMLGMNKSLQTLRELGFRHLLQGKDYGDSLILGGAEVNLLELTQAYSTLARLGQGISLSYLDEEKSQIAEESENFFPDRSVNNHRLQRRNFSRAASWLIADILSDPARLPFNVQVGEAREEAPVSFKTGTSYGFRDAWCLAYYPEYTIAIWFGREDGQPDNMLIGLPMAAPVATDLARKLARQAVPSLQYFEKEQDIESQAVCALSGSKPSPWCPIIEKTDVIKSKMRSIPCDMHVYEEGRVKIAWPFELENFPLGRNLDRARLALSRPISISSPIPNTEYIISPGIDSKPISLKAEGVSYPVHWFVDDEYLGVQKEEGAELYWKIKEGEHSLSLIDAEERSTRSSLSLMKIEKKKKSELPSLF